MLLCARVSVCMHACIFFFFTAFAFSHSIPFVHSLHIICYAHSEPHLASIHSDLLEKKKQERKNKQRLCAAYKCSHVEYAIFPAYLIEMQQKLNTLGHDRERLRAGDRGGPMQATGTEMYLLWQSNNRMHCNSV